MSASKPSFFAKDPARRARPTTSRRDAGHSGKLALNKLTPRMALAVAQFCGARRPLAVWASCPPELRRWLLRATERRLRALRKLGFELTLIRTVKVRRRKAASRG